MPARMGGFRRIGVLPLLLSAAVLMGNSAVPVQRAGASAGLLSRRGPDREHRVKAVFLFNFAQFVDWPDSAFAGPDSPLVIGILGDDPFREFLDEVVAGESVKGHPLEVARFRRLEEVGGCHILFISPAAARSLDWRIASLRHHGILTVGESGDFLDDGGMVLFVKEGGRVRFRVNREAVQEAGLSLSSKLLRLADSKNGPRE